MVRLAKGEISGVTSALPPGLAQTTFFVSGSIPLKFGPL